ncbi:uncharacterized protein [Malus domestica]|uniref:uncharacterized protein n=1 Tax=Malus domestica TaxID=3750 RepID=UPI0039770AA8
MVTIFKSFGLWNLVEKGITTSNPKKKEAGEASEDDEAMVAALMKDAKALGIIQNAISDQIFPRIANAESAKMAWDLLYGEYHGGDQMRTFGESLSNERLVQKVLISLSKPYDSICLVIENTKCLETVELQEVVVILKSQEQRFDLHTVDTTRKAFSSFSVSSKEQNRGEGQSGSSQFQKNWNNKGKKWGSKPKFQQKFPANSAHNAQSMGQIGTKPQCRVCSKFHFGECRYKGKPKCYNYEKFGHWARECTVGKSVQKANSANQVEVTGNLFYANSTITESKVNGEWYVDSGCSNHMTGDSKLLIDMKTNVVGKVQMPT